ncbi:MAG TPA: hypothetical protein VK841_17470 [Polyangiaceae bacterium]|jgi:hypothetical protein|nr:hypothetical protein [Polyangiaceae bacterium]
MGRSRAGGAPTWARSVAVAIAATTTACVRPAGYSGMGALTISGQPALLTQVTVKVTSCVVSQPTHAGPESAGPLDGPDAASLSYNVISIGPACRIVWIPSGIEDRPTGDETCALDFPEGRQTLRVTNVSMHIPRYPRNGNVVGYYRAELEVGGQDLATGKYVLFQFKGSGIDTDPDPGACEKQPARQAMTSAAR